jgi:hypothetical protein
MSFGAKLRTLSLAVVLAASAVMLLSLDLHHTARPERLRYSEARGGRHPVATPVATSRA